MRRVRHALCYFTLTFLALGTAASADPDSHYPLLPYSPKASTKAQCAIPPAREQAEIARRLLDHDKFDQAYTFAGSAWQYLGACHLGEGDDRIAGDAIFIIAVVEAHRGQDHLASQDSGIAIAEYQFCYEKKGASSDDVAYCHSMEHQINNMTR